MTSLGEEPDYKKLRKLTADQILKDGIDENIYKERNCSSLNEYINKIKNTNFYADEPELFAIAKIKRIWISIYNKQLKNWNILKNSENVKPINIAFIYFNNKRNNDFSNHYNALNFNNHIKKTKKEIKNVYNNNIKNVDNDIKTGLIQLEDNVNNLNKQLYIIINELQNIDNKINNNNELIFNENTTSGNFQFKNKTKNINTCYNNVIDKFNNSNIVVNKNNKIINTLIIIKHYNTKYINIKIYDIFS